MWSLIRKLKTRFMIKTCGENILTIGAIQSVVEALEQELKAKGSETIMNLTDSELKTSSEMFIYLVSCYKEMSQWYWDYQSLFKNGSPREIILQLNRLMRMGDPVQARLFKIVEKELDLKVEVIQNLVLGTNNSSYGTENSIDMLKGLKYLIIYQLYLHEILSFKSATIQCT